MYIINSILLFLASTTLVFADTLPKDWQLSFQEPATDLMADVMNFHSYILMPIITAISLLVLGLIVQKTQLHQQQLTIL